MEGEFRVNWPAIVEEAKQRRKAQKLTQERLAELAGVSTPTISHFESGKKDLQLSTVNSILKVLGMLDERTLIFPDPRPRRDFDRMSVVFDGRDGDKTVRCAISEEALGDHFGDNDRRSLSLNGNPLSTERLRAASSAGSRGPGRPRRCLRCRGCVTPG